jgi:LPXTG-site transpeptidase (sortase) family protein
MLLKAMITLRRFNNVLSFVVVALGLYIILTPFLPQLQFALRDKSPEASAPYGGNLAESVGSESVTPDVPKENRIVIPSIQVNEPILEGSGIGVINNGGTWRRPNASLPTENNNTVIVGHRFYGNNVSTFYHLDKVLPGQKLALYWEGKEILYEVTETKVVEATAVEIEAKTLERRLTIYTCHPVWTAKNRLVVIAKPVTELEQERVN